jgi:hypothetical protein
MSQTPNNPGAISANPDERLRQIYKLTPEQFAIETGANIGFSPAHPREWERFWKFDIAEQDEFHSCFPSMTLAEAQRVWHAMEKHFFAQYDMFVRVWPEWCSSGIWAPQYPGSRTVGPMLDYDQLDLPVELVARFKAWQADFNAHDPGGPFDWDGISQTAHALAQDLKAVLGPKIYVEQRELLEILPDGSTESCRPRLGLE